MTHKEVKEKEYADAKAIVDMSDEEIAKMDYKQKQKHFRERNKLCKVVYQDPYNNPYKKKEGQ